MVDVEWNARTFVIRCGLARAAALARLDQAELSVALFNGDARRGDAVFLENAQGRNLARTIRLAVHRSSQSFDGETFTIPDVYHSGPGSPPYRAMMVAAASWDSLAARLV